MGQRFDPVIVFGATGAVGSAAALEASKRGATVWLAVRDTNKPIDGIPDGDSGKFHRVKADLIDPESVRAAIQKSGAKAAFVYFAFGPNGLKPTLEVMKEAGIEYVVFLSSFTIDKGKDVRDIPPEDVIPYIHAQIEAALEDLGLAHTALRPGSFASNPFKMGMDNTKNPPEVYTFGAGKRPVDNIVPLDIGRVGGAVLVDRPSTSSKEIIYLYGPNMTTELGTAETVKKHSPSEIKVVQQTPEEWTDRMKAKGLPPPLINYMVKASKDVEGRTDLMKVFPEDVDNIRKYSGYEPTTFEEFLGSWYAK